MYCSVCVVYWDDREGEICWNCGGHENTFGKIPAFNNGAQSPIYGIDPNAVPPIAPPPNIQAEEYLQMWCPEGFDVLEYFA